MHLIPSSHDQMTTTHMASLADLIHRHGVALFVGPHASIALAKLFILLTPTSV